MAHITVPEGVPGILGPMMRYPETAQALNALAQTLLRGESSLLEAERELIAAFVSRLNDCTFCCNSHAATSRYLFGERCDVVDSVLEDVASAPISERAQSLLAIAAKVQQGGRHVEDADVARAREAGADDRAIHDTVLIAAAFCMFNRYVDGLATWAPQEPSAYEAIGARLGAHGYVGSVNGAA